MAINFSSINLEVIDLTTNATPDIFINQNCITFSRRVLDDMNFPQNVQYCVDAPHKIFAIRSCKANEVKSATFSKPKTEQTATLTCGNKNLRDIILMLIPNSDPTKRYKVTGEYDSENRVMYFDMTTAEVCNFRTSASKDE